MEIFSRIFPNGLKSFDVAIFHIDMKWVFKSNAGQKCLAPLHLSIKIFYKVIALHVNAMALIFFM